MKKTRKQLKNKEKTKKEQVARKLYVLFIDK